MKMQTPFGTRRAEYHVISSSDLSATKFLSKDDLNMFETFDTVYRSLCATLYNFAPLSGHPGGSISSGRFVSALLYNSMNYDVSNHERNDSDILSYSAGHKALGLYAHWALRNEIVRIGAHDYLPTEIDQQLRLEDLLGFRKNPSTKTPLFLKFKSKALDGHPTPATPFIKLSTGASGIGVASSIGLAYAAADYYGPNAPVIHMVEGEGGLTPGRVSEAMASAGTASLKNVIMHIDWNNASIDSNNVCREDSKPGEYVQWNPAELAYFHDWNVIFVEDGKDFQSIIAAQRKAAAIKNNQPTAIVYRTVKGWNYGIEGKSSHGAGHNFCSAGYFNALKPLLGLTGKNIELCNGVQECGGGKNAAMVEECFWDALLIFRDFFESNKNITNALAKHLLASCDRLNKLDRHKKNNAPDITKIYDKASNNKQIPPSLQLENNASTTLRGELGKVLQYYNKLSNGAIFTSAADLLGSTSVNTIGKDFADGFFNAHTNPFARTLSVGGICEDAMSGVASGISALGHHIGVCSSYGAFMAPLGHISARLHAIGEQSKKTSSNKKYNPFFLVCAHTGIKTGEDGPTHADPQPLQIVQENFPDGTMISLTPWDPQDIWYLVTAALSKRPAVICPFVTRPNEKIIDRKSLGLAPAADSAKGIYLLCKPSTKNPQGTIVLQGSEVAYVFVNDTLPMLLKKNIDVAVYYVASAELFNLLSKKEQEEIFPQKAQQEAMAITGFTLPTMYRWIQSDYGREHSIYPFKKGHFLGSGKAESVILEAGLDGESQFNAILDYVNGRKKEIVVAAKIYEEAAHQ
ncbi:MAG TPA: hypothetical protein VHP12_01530 [Chitinophagaceae bacterium]|nr:hypothetical protein [Chitinophagaceae bacterium]